MIGRNIIRLKTCPGTSNYVAKSLDEGNYELGTVIMADFQTSGQGRRGKSWQSAAGENLTFSFAVDSSFLNYNNLFLLSKAFSLATANTLKSFQIPEVAIKWPNDILSGSFKLSGLLIENRGSADRVSICGIGLNVNQMEFDRLPMAGSMARCAGFRFDKEEVLASLLNELNREYDKLRSGNFEPLSREYFDLLLGSRLPIVLTLGNQKFRSRILSVADDGALKVIGPEGEEESYYLDQVKVEYPR